VIICYYLFIYLLIYLFIIISVLVITGTYVFLSPVFGIVFYCVSVLLIRLFYLVFPLRREDTQQILASDMVSWNDRGFFRFLSFFFFCFRLFICLSFFLLFQRENALVILSMFHLFQKKNLLKKGLKNIIPNYNYHFFLLSFFHFFIFFLIVIFIYFLSEFPLIL
jgi:hypothetical protein